MGATLTIDGTAYDQDARKANSLIVDAWGWDLDDDYWLEFHEYCAGFQPLFAGPKAVSYTDASSTLRFTGDITGVQPSWSGEGRTWGYRCQGLKYRANWIPVTGIDGSELMTFNLRLDQEDYLASNAGKSVGDILSAVFTQHASALTAAGISTDSTTASQLASMTLVPNDPVYIEGERLLQAMENLLRRWYRNYRLRIKPDGKIRFIDITTGSSHTLTLGEDPVDPPLFSRDWTHCASRVVNRGKGKIYPAVVSILNGTLVPAWTSTQQADWTMADFDAPGDAYDTGTVTTTGGPTSITVQSNNAATTWPTNFWSDREAWVYLQSSSGTGITYSESRPVTACSAMTAGGTATLTLGLDLDNSSSTAWDSYTLVGRAGDLAAGRNNVYRLFDVVTPGNWIEQHLVKQFPTPVPFIGLNNASAQLTSVPVCMVIYQGGTSQVPATFRVIPSTGQILFDRPYLESFNQPADLATGGGAVVQAYDVVVMLAYSRGALEAPYPPDVSGSPVYAGTSHDAGLDRTLYVDNPSWQYEGNRDMMVDLAQMIHQSVKDTVVEGHVTYKGEYTDVLDPDTGHLLSFAYACGATGDEALAVPVRAVTVKLNPDGGGLKTITQMQCSSRREPRTASDYYQHLSQLGSGIATFGGVGALGGGPVYAGPQEFGGDFGGGGSGDFGGFGGGFGSPGGPGNYRRRRGTASKDIGKGSSTPESRDAAAKQHQEELQAARDRSANHDDAPHQAALQEQRTRGEAGAAMREADAQKVRDEGRRKTAARQVDAQKVRRQGEDKAAQHQKDLEQARRDSTTKGMLADAGFPGTPIQGEDS